MEFFSRQSQSWKTETLRKQTVSIYAMQCYAMLCYAMGAKTGKKTLASRPSLASTLFLPAQTFNSLLSLLRKNMQKSRSNRQEIRTEVICILNSVSKKMHSNNQIFARLSPRVGESPWSHGHFGISRVIVSFFVCEIQSFFEDALRVQIKFPWQNLWSVKLKISMSHSKRA